MTPLERQVTNLELSKKLEAVGLKPKSLFKWRHGYGEPFISYGGMCESAAIVAPALTISELFDLLPQVINWHLTRLPDRWEFGSEGIWGKGETAVDAVGDLVVKLVEQGLVKP
jgi:hypothetical protein